MSQAVGIDLGTSNSAVAVLDDDGRPRILTTAEGSTTLPSLVWFSPQGAVVGEAAREGLDHSPDVTIFGVKRLMGRRFDHPDVRRMARVLPYELVAAPNGYTLIALGQGQTVSPEEVSALVLLELRRMAEAFLGGEVVEAVITVPAWFDTAQRQATKDAAEIAGLRVRRLLSEPTAAAFGHGAHRGERRRFVVCDLGGGTFDVAVVDVDSGVFEVLSTTGDPFLGGDDVDRAIVENLVRDVRVGKGLDVSADAGAIDRLRVAAQRAKHELSAELSTSLHIPELLLLPSGKAVEYSRSLRRDEVELWSAPLFRRLESPCRDALMRASRSADQVDDVLLVGGMTRMPAVRRQLARIFGKEPSSVANPEEVVAVGAALEVARLDGQIDGVLIIDVCARGLSISPATSGPSGAPTGPCDLVIGPNSVVPTREHRVFLTKQANQQAIEFDLWEGSSSDAASNTHLGRFAVVELPPAPAGEVLALVEVTIDVDGTVRLAGTELISSQGLSIEQLSHTGLPRIEIERLANEHGRRGRARTVSGAGEGLAPAYPPRADPRTSPPLSPRPGDGGGRGGDRW
ncbi:MAG: Hsp70 family protein [Myxococcales bacterium]|nr:Hsp70 family protein [Myxococcales bacterium]HRC57257.1 Hsp70 family protein [Kofleriaceae bacterium]